MALLKDLIKKITGGDKAAASAQDTATAEEQSPQARLEALREGRDELVFMAHVTDGMGMYSELTFPTRRELFNMQAAGTPVAVKPDTQWLDTIQPGSLNATIARDGYPAALEALGQGYQVQKLDNGTFEPELVIPQNKIGRNMIKPSAHMPEKGAAQIWPCEVENLKTHEKFNAYAVRRIGSAYHDVIELMSDKKLRDAHKLETGTPIKLTLLSSKRK